ncbi:hypothetical protein BS47DRAFT_1359637 [Hydnum rufescens UP504]|uniref:Uncharacterized protein n=1 Tax=Hydnum rufescens UP504 TaxID=1448309 RepID=A0A9P6E022_9AGAM|nr:hypothetical protein BS47DRAFT_1359637 [Hydnum rufescens UP504]
MKHMQQNRWWGGGSLRLSTAHTVTKRELAKHKNKEHMHAYKGKGSQGSRSSPKKSSFCEKVRRPPLLLRPKERKQYDEGNRTFLWGRQKICRQMVRNPKKNKSGIPALYPIELCRLSFSTFGSSDAEVTVQVASESLPNDWPNETHKWGVTAAKDTCGSGGILCFIPRAGCQFKGSSNTVSWVKMLQLVSKTCSITVGMSVYGFVVRTCVWRNPTAPEDQERN